MIHVIGDSHVSLFTGLHGVCPPLPDATPHALPSFRVAHLGPFLAHSLTTPSHRVRTLAARALRSIPRESHIAFLLGEIDCRNHIVKRGSARSSIQRNATDLAHRYVASVHALASPRSPRSLALIAPPPATDTAHGNQQQPSVGTHAQRTLAVRTFTKALQHAAGSLGMRVFTSLAKLHDRSRRPLPVYFADGVHADPRCLPSVLPEFVSAGWLSPAAPDLAIASALALVAPPAPLALPAGLADPRVARLTLAQLAAWRCRARGATTVALYGAGSHTAGLGLACFRRAGLRIAAILDDHPSLSRLHGVRVLHPSRAPKGLDAIIISSDAHEPAMLLAARQRFGSAMLIMPIYTQATA